MFCTIHPLQCINSWTVTSLLPAILALHCGSKEKRENLSWLAFLTFLYLHFYFFLQPSCFFVTVTNRVPLLCFLCKPSKRASPAPPSGQVSILKRESRSWMARPGRERGNRVGSKRKERCCWMVHLNYEEFSNKIYNVVKIFIRVFWCFNTTSFEGMTFTSFQKKDFDISANRQKSIGRTGKK